MRAAAHLTYSGTKSRCPNCRRAGAEALRVQWGCDEPAAAPVFSITCPRCSGYDMACPDCGGSGEKAIFRCPPSQVDENATEVIRALVAYEDGHLPDAGGLYDQSAALLDAFAVARSERSAIDAEERRVSDARAHAKHAGGRR